MKNKKSNVKKETQNLLRFLYEDENPTGAAKNIVYVSDGNISKSIANITGINPAINTVVALSDEQINRLSDKVRNLKPITLPPNIKKYNPDFPNVIYTTYTSSNELEVAMSDIINNMQVINLSTSSTPNEIYDPDEVPNSAPAKPAVTVNQTTKDTTGTSAKQSINMLKAAENWAKAHQGSLIGAGVGAGITAAGWAAARAYLQRQLRNCGDNEKCKKAINAKIKKLNRMALMGGIGLTALGAAAQPLSTAFKQRLGNAQQANKTINKKPTDLPD